jgi:hypothetical protein
MPDIKSRSRRAPLGSLFTAWCAALFLLSPAAEAASRPQQIWFVASPYAETHLYEPNAPWPMAASKVRVFEIYTSWLNQGSDADLKSFFQFLKQHDMALSVEFGILNQTDSCGAGIEGFAGGGAKAATAAAQKIERLGGELAYIAMDEPYWNGHIRSGSQQCKWTPAEIAKNAASTIAAFRAVFPEVAFGDIEPITETGDGGDLAQQYAEWAEAWRTTAGTPLGFFHADVVWRGKNVAILAKFARSLQQKNIPFGVIYNGEPNDLSDKMWLDNARRHFESFENGTNPLPSHVIFQSWNAYPKRLLPETNPESFTSLVLEYFKARTRFVGVTKTGATIAGRLHGDDDNPVAAGPVSVEALNTRAAGQYQQSINGNVPSSAVKMLVGWRINTECSCNGQADIVVSPARFESSEGGTQRIDLAALGRYPGDRAQPMRERAAGPATDSIHVKAAPGQALVANGQKVDVKGATPFTFTIPYAVNGSTTDAVSAHVIFFDATGKELVRYRLALVPQWTALAQSRTDPSGQFEIALASSANNSETALRLVFAGDTTHRAVTKPVP